MGICAGRCIINNRVGRTWISCGHFERLMSRFPRLRCSQNTNFALWDVYNVIIFAWSVMFFCHRMHYEKLFTNLKIYIFSKVLNCSFPYCIESERKRWCERVYVTFKTTKWELGNFRVPMVGILERGLSWIPSWMTIQNDFTLSDLIFPPSS